MPPAPGARLALPSTTPPPARSGFPLLAVLAPIGMAAVLWAVTGSALSLLFAGLGPVLAVGGMLDARRSRRSALRRESARYAAALDVLGERVDAGLAAEAAEHERRATAAATATPGTMIPGWAPGAVPVRLGRADLPAALEVAGDPAEELPPGLVARGRMLQARAATLPAAVLALDVADGLTVRGPATLGAAIARAVVLGIVRHLDPGTAVLRVPPGEDWAAALPHPTEPGAAGCWLLVDEQGRRIAVRWASGEAGSPSSSPGGLVLTLDDGGAELSGGELAGRLALHPEARSRREAARDAARLAVQIGGGSGRAARLPTHVALAELRAHPTEPDDVGSLDAVLGVGPEGPVRVDLVADGPHALVAGTTGSGKSELLVAWVAALAARYRPEQVGFLLVDFKGGAAFASLTGLPHVVGVVSDLDVVATRRAIEGLRAELRRRERVLADAACRAIEELPPGRLGRLVVVVDEFAAVVAETPELHDAFADLAARGRSLGIHLVLCTQRPSGVVRDAVLANVGLRIGLRTTDRADSLALLDAEDAFRLPAAPRGRAVLRRGETRTPVQIALAGPADLAAALPAGARMPHRPWLPPLPHRLRVDALPAAPHGQLGFGLLDRPAEQAQPLAAHDPSRGHLVVLGGPGAGATTALATLAAAALRAGAVVVRAPAAPAELWALLVPLVDRPTARATVLVLDGLDVALDRTPDEYRSGVIELLLELARRGSGMTLLASARRLSGPAAALASAFPERLLLRHPSRDDLVWAGGDPRWHDPRAVPGAGYWRGDPVQVALPAAPDAEERGGGRSDPSGPSCLFDPMPGPTPFAFGAHPVLALVAGRPRRQRSALDAAGVRVVDISTTADADELVVSRGDAPTVLLGDPDAWQGAWALLGRARRDLPLLLLGCGVADYRALTRDRELPPLLSGDASEGWLVLDGRVERIRITQHAQSDPEPDRPSHR